MFRFEPGLKVYLYREPVDGRKAINGLALLVEQSLGLNPFEPAPSTCSAIVDGIGSSGYCGKVVY